jgi:hypothetical protein
VGIYRSLNSLSSRISLSCSLAHSVLVPGRCASRSIAVLSSIATRTVIVVISDAVKAVAIAKPFGPLSECCLKRRRGRGLWYLNGSGNALQLGCCQLYGFSVEKNPARTRGTSSQVAN